MKPKKKQPFPPKPWPLPPNEVVGFVLETHVSHGSPWAPASKHMTVRWLDGTVSEKFPMIVVANPGDAFVFTLRPHTGRGPLF